MIIRSMLYTLCNIFYKVLRFVPSEKRSEYLSEWNLEVKRLESIYGESK